MDAAEDRPIPAWPPARWLLLAFAALLALFYLTRPAPIQWGDGLELAAVSSHLGVAHPTGYPLFTLLGWIAEKLPVYTPYARLLLLGRLFSCATVLAIALLIRTRLRAAGLTDRAATVAALCAGLCVAVSAPLRGTVQGLEVYGLNAALLALIALAATGEATPRRVLLSGVLLGLAASNHLTSLCMAPLVLLQAISCAKSTRQFAYPIAALAAAALIPLALYGSLLARVPSPEAHGIYWGETSGLSNLLTHVRGGEYKQYQFLQERPGTPFTPGSYTQFAAGRALQFLGSLGSMLFGAGPTSMIGGLLLFACAAASLAASIRRGTDRLPALGIIAALLLQLDFIFTYNIPDISDYFLGVTVLLIPRAFVGGLIGLRALLAKFQFSAEKTARALLLVPAALALLALPGLLRWGPGPTTLLPELWLERVTKALPQGAAVVTAMDADTYSFWYLQFAEKKRPDLFVLGGNFLRFPWCRRTLPPADPRRNLVAFRDGPPRQTLQEYIADLRTGLIDPILPHGPVYTTAWNPMELEELKKTYDVRVAAQLLTDAEWQAIEASGEINVAPPMLYEIRPRGTAK